MWLKHAVSRYSIWLFFFVKQKTAYELRISDWSSDVCSSDLPGERVFDLRQRLRVLQAEFGFAVNCAAQSHEIVEQGFGLGGPASGHLVHLFPPNNCRPARSSMISSLPPPIALTRTSRSEEHTSEIQSLMRNSSAVFCLTKKKNKSQSNLHYYTY